MRLFPTDTNRKQLSLKIFFWVFFICVSVASWIGISTIQADENDPGEYMQNNEVNFQNAAQERHAKNLAIKLTLRDPEVMKAVSEAKDREDYKEARSLFKDALAENMQQISNMRAEGWGWGNIAKYYEVHPKYLGLGHYKHKAKHAGLNDSSQNKDGGLALGQIKDKGGGHGGGNGHGKGGGNGGGHGAGKNK